MAALKAIQKISRSPFAEVVLRNAYRPFSACCQAAMSSAHQQPIMIPRPCPLAPTSLLSPVSVSVTQIAGMKIMGKLRKRCKHCFFVMIDERLHVWCDVHPRHKQMQLIPKPQKVVITTHATQGRLRPW